MLLLPTPSKKTHLKLYFKSRKGKYLFAAIIDFWLIVLILFTGMLVDKPSGKLISPFFTTFQSVYSLTQNKPSGETFAFVPDLARNKFPDVELGNLTYLSFFDVPLTEDGQINHNSRGYASFTSDGASSLFDRARASKTKIFLTLSSPDEDIISNLLNNKDAQEKLADQATQEIKTFNIDGITIDFELPSGQGKTLQARFTNFVSLFTKRVKDSMPNAQVAVVIPSAFGNQSLYDMGGLSRASSKIFLMASDFAVPEVDNHNRPANPTFGYNENQYWGKVSAELNGVLRKAGQNKLVMERAWYGNGNNYPLYTPNTSPMAEQASPPSPVKLDQGEIDKLVAGVPEKGRAAAKRNIPYIVKALAGEGILDSNVLAYALATIEHETDGTFEPLEEIQGRFSARRLGYEGGTDYFGRGFIQLTHLRNYKAMGERIGIGDELVKNPDLAATPEIAAKILAAFFKDNNVANLASQGLFVSARVPINPDYNGWSVAQLAMKYETN